MIQLPKKKKEKKNWNERDKNVLICTLCYCLHRKFKRIQRQAVSTNRIVTIFTPSNNKLENMKECYLY